MGVWVHVVWVGGGEENSYELGGKGGGRGVPDLTVVLRELLLVFGFRLRVRAPCSSVSVGFFGRGSRWWGGGEVLPFETHSQLLPHGCSGVST